MKSLDDASRAGVPLVTGGRLFLIPIGNKGDWPYLATGVQVKFEMFSFNYALPPVYKPDSKQGSSSYIRPKGSRGLRGQVVRVWFCLFDFLFPLDQVSTVCSQLQATSAKLNRSYRNVPRAATSAAPCTGICHLCLAGRPMFDFEQMYFGNFCTKVWPCLGFLFQHIFLRPLTFGPSIGNSSWCPYRIISYPEVRCT